MELYSLEYFGNTTNILRDIYSYMEREKIDSNLLFDQKNIYSLERLHSKNETTINRKRMDLPFYDEHITYTLYLFSQNGAKKNIATYDVRFFQNKLFKPGVIIQIQSEKIEKSFSYWYNSKGELVKIRKAITIYDGEENKDFYSYVFDPMLSTLCPIFYHEGRVERKGHKSFTDIQRSIQRENNGNSNFVLDHNFFTDDWIIRDKNFSSVKAKIQDFSDYISVWDHYIGILNPFTLEGNIAPKEELTIDTFTNLEYILPFTIRKISGEVFKRDFISICNCIKASE